MRDRYMTMTKRTKNWKELQKKYFTPQEIAEDEEYARREIMEMNLREVRQLVGKTQEELAAAASLEQSALSRAERRDDHLLSTLRKYIEGLGGEIEVIARFGNKTVKLRGV